MDQYSSELQKVVISLLGFMAKNLEVDQNKLINMFNEGVQGVRMNYYPPCQQADKVLGLSPHSDATGLTLLIQVNEVQGLQIRRDGKWVLVKPISGAFIVNVGDVIEVKPKSISLLLQLHMILYSTAVSIPCTCVFICFICRY